MKLVYNGIVKDSGLHVNNRRRFDQEVKNFLHKEVTITVELKRKKRSLSQNAYFHGVVIPLCKDGLNGVGYKFTLEQTKTKLKEMFAHAEMANEITGEYMSYTKDTSDMTTSEMMDFVADIQQWASEFLGVYIPDPGEQLTMEL